ncbi:MAG: hypothetical protein PHS33_07895 [Candidatus Omnitrophica bacterium]|nr:hypothetical protein [Candidatus Omnitrophota bacterium]
MLKFEDLAQINPKETDYEIIKKLHNFYNIKWTTNQDGIDEFNGVVIDKVKFVELLKDNGIYRYDINLETIKFIRIQDNIIEEISQENIIDFFIAYIEKLPVREGANKEYTITPEMLKSKVFNSLNYLFSPILLRRTTPKFKITLFEDTRPEKYLYYQNGLIKVNKDQFVFLPYESISDAYIWKSGILQRNFIKDDGKKSMFEKFIEKVCSNDIDRILSIMSITGYNLHGYTRGKSYATILTDANTGEDGEANGRTGKTLYGKGLGHMLNTKEESTVYIEISGRDFNIQNKFRYEFANLNTKLVHLNDMFNYFNIEHIFSDITEGISVNKKNEKPFRQFVKLLISTNKTIRIEGESAKDRTIIFEFSDYFNADRSPATEFGCWFFDDWDHQEWARFDRFMINCLMVFFKHGLIRPGSINLQHRTLIDHTHKDFVMYIDAKFSKYDDTGEPNGNVWFINDAGTEIRNLTRYNKKDEYFDFIKAFPDFEKSRYFNQAKFIKWLKRYFKLKMPELEFVELRSSDAYFFALRKFE